MTKQNYTQEGGQHLESQVLKKMHRRIVKSFMDILILSELQNGPMSGYDAITFIHNKFGILVSSGTVYSLSYSLERDGLIKGMWAKRKKSI
jgi:DNA-binding PadR family transcriptional regulator